MTRLYNVIRRRVQRFAHGMDVVGGLVRWPGVDELVAVWLPVRVLGILGVFVPLVEAWWSRECWDDGELWFGCELGDGEL